MLKDPFRSIVLAMAEARPNARASTVVSLALAAESAIVKLDINSPASLARWASSNKEVADFLRDGNRIPAIREVRVQTGAGLKAAKEAIELLEAGAA